VARTKHEIVIKDTHRGLWYVDGVLTRIVEAGRYEIPADHDWLGRSRPRVELVIVDVRQRELTIKGQEILTADKVAIRVSIIVQFRVTDAKAAIHEVDNYEERLYSDVQLAARRSLASTSLEEILTNRNRLSEDILRDVKETASAYGVGIMRADVKDLVFPGNLQEIMNKVLAAERTAEAQLVEARTRAQTQPRVRSVASTRRRRPPPIAWLPSPRRKRRGSRARPPWPRSGRVRLRVQPIRRIRHCSGYVSWRRSASWPRTRTPGSTSDSTSILMTTRGIDTCVRGFCSSTTSGKTWTF
jgi:hypothetical protein